LRAKASKSKQKHVNTANLRAKARQYSEFASKSKQKHVNTANLRAKASKSKQKRAKATNELRHTGL
jgi:hypothetical protein